MSAFNSQFTDAGYYVPNQQQRFFASRALELLSIHREVIHGNNPTDFQQHSAGASTNDYCFKKPTYTATPWWPSIDTSVTSSTNPNLLLQPCFPWPLLTMSPVFGGDSVPNMPELLMPQTSPQTCTTGLTEASLALMNSLPSSPHAPLVCNDSGFVPVMQLDDDQLYSRICEYRASGMTWQDMSEAFSTIDGGGLSATHLAYFYFRRHPQQQSIPVASHRFVPYTVKKSSRKSDSTEHAKLAYLNVDQFKQLQRLVSDMGLLDKFRGASYFSPMTQVVLVGFVCFLCPGMFNALNGMGGGGQVDRTTGNNANTALYCTFIIFGVLGGAIVNLCGVRWTIFGSGLTYALYSSSYIYLNHTGNGAFTIAAGAILGIGAGILWAAQGMIMVSYPREEEKGRYIAVFWIIFNMGGMLGGILPFAINYNSTKDSLSDGVYIAFVILECIGAALGLALAPPSKVVREDGSSVVLVKYTSVRIEAVEILKLFMNPMMLALLPMCFASNFFYSYQFGPINGSIFNIRTRGFNNIFYWGAQMIGAYALSFLLDNQRMTRKTRGIIALGIVAVFFNVVWGGTLKLQQKYTHGPLPGGIPTDYPGGLIDFLESKRAAGPIILYTLHGVGDALYQNLAYWVIGSLTNDGQKLSRYAGFYKGIQSLGATVAWQLDAKSVSYMNQLIGNWVLLGISMFPMFYVVYTLKDHSEETKVQTDDYDDREKV
ncbi:hypothetical protein GGI14_005578 [Coemansia sp. S680]|nr:hypothetical protein GGI14_005578 [Coemansia sp. S680]